MARVGLSDAGAGWLRWLPARFAALAVLAALSREDTLRTYFDTDRAFAAASARGTLIVAVPPRPQPTLTVGHVDRTLRSPDPFSAALANDLGRRAGLPVTFVLAEPRAAQEAVRSGKADVAIAGLPFAPEASLAFAPTSYSTGRGLALVLRHGNVKDWDDLRGRAICASAGSPFAAQAARRHHATLQSFERPLDALLAFQAGECAALVDDELVVRALLKQSGWAYYRALPGTIAASPAFIASAGGDVPTAASIDDAVRDWRRERWLSAVRQDLASRLAFDMFNAENDLYCH
ncbi:transporter substrate-binding domain-containing protein [Caballeronia humi]|uniref:Bacterial extracellular solute-binding proteins, family 3 n=1 Tax=Caballeronia humi TaxID=326474 RepID=A0A158IF70_9BURK|nr:transporter substrate-binding domain-containing protein [Caballeronia humi]SAL54899.1 Bacterial extracellular solute-binding proteins, family 3 [Caballeronia humi]